MSMTDEKLTEADKTIFMEVEDVIMQSNDVSHTSA